ncbi:kinase-like domain-containing protein [Phlyctochytrium arcticum]|nr:kinase-like domain-containing protein [Phlyctochytrium arcticum]
MENGVTQILSSSPSATPPAEQLLNTNPRPSATIVGPYRLSKTLGQGSMGKVKLALHTITGERRACKIISRPPNSRPLPKTTDPKKHHCDVEDSKEARIVREAAIMLLLYHPHIVRLHDIVMQEEKYFMFLEYCQGSQLLDYIISHGKLREKVARRYIRQIVSAIDYCHQNSIVHRDLKIENVLIDKDGSIKLIDFGLSNLFAPSKQLQTFCGSLYFAAPELLCAKAYTGPEVDVWSLGVILYVIVCGKVPFDDASIPVLHSKIKAGMVEYPPHLSDECRHLLSRLLVVQPDRRATLQEIKSHPWMIRGYETPPDNYLPTRAPITLPLDPDVLQRMRGFDFGSPERIQAKLEQRIEQGGALIRNGLPVDPLVSIYYLVMEKMEREKWAEATLGIPVDAADARAVRRRSHLDVVPQLGADFAFMQADGVTLERAGTTRTAMRGAHGPRDVIPPLPVFNPSTISNKPLPRIPELPKAVEPPPPLFASPSSSGSTLSPPTPTPAPSQQFPFPAAAPPPPPPTESRTFGKILRRMATTIGSTIGSNHSSSSSSATATTTPHPPTSISALHSTPRTTRRKSSFDLKPGAAVLPADPPPESRPSLALHTRPGRADEHIRTVSLKHFFSVVRNASTSPSAIRQDLLKVLHREKLFWVEYGGGFECEYGTEWNASRNTTMPAESLLTDPSSSAGGSPDPLLNDMEEDEEEEGEEEGATTTSSSRRRFSFISLSSIRRSVDAFSADRQPFFDAFLNPQLRNTGGSTTITPNDTPSSSTTHTPVPVPLPLPSSSRPPPMKNVTKRSSRSSLSALRASLGASPTTIPTTMQSESPALVRMEIFIVKVPWLGLHGLQFRRLSGNTGLVSFVVNFSLM